MVSIPRQGQYGFPVKLPPSTYTQQQFRPTSGFTDLPDVSQTPGSITSGENVWIWQDRLQPRPYLQQLGTSNALGDAGVGAFVHLDVDGSEHPVVASQGTVSALVGGDWQTLVYQSGASNFPLSGGRNDLIFGTSVYLPRINSNIAVLVNGVDPAFVARPSFNTTLSTGTQVLIAKDIAEFDTRLIYWNVQYLSGGGQQVQRVAWTVKGNPEDLTSIGAGFQDLFDMKGFGTRMFPRVNELFLATDQEIWRGNAVGPPFDFQFTPFSRVLGVPYPRAAINTPDGLFWMGPDFMVYRVQPYFWSQVEPVGKDIQRTLHSVVGDPTSFFFGFHADAKQLSLYFTASGDTQPLRAFTLNTLTGSWTPQRFAHGLTVGFTTPITSTATQWNQLIGSFASQTMTYNQLFGASDDFSEAVVSSVGTTYVFQHASAQSSDDGVAVPQDVVLGTFFAGMPERRKLADTVRLNMRADLASTVSVSVSGDLGATYGAERLVSVSAASNSSQYVLKVTPVDGVYHTVRIRSTNGQWELASGAVGAKVQGEVI